MSSPYSSLLLTVPMEKASSDGFTDGIISLFFQIVIYITRNKASSDRFTDEKVVPPEIWVASHFTDKGHEEWIKEYADLNRVYLGGDSAGGTIAHNIALRASIEALNCPYFLGKDPIGNEETHPVYPKAFLDKVWLYACPTATDCDHPLINPEMEPKLSSLGCKRLLVYASEKDVLRGRGLRYKETLERIGWDGDIEVVDVEGEDHLFSVFSPTSESGMAMLKKVASFLNH